MIKVYAMNVSGIDISDKALLKKMSPKRMDKLERLKPEKSKRQSIGAELLLNYALKKELNVKTPVIWDTDENGKLFIPDCTLNVNLSHSGNYAVCAVSDMQVGVDIQKMDKANMALAQRFFTSEECEFIKTNDDFYDIWVKKESLIKAVGKGLAIPLSSFSVLGSAAEFKGKIYTFKKYTVCDKEYKLCVCVSHG